MKRSFLLFNLFFSRLLISFQDVPENCLTVPQKIAYYFDLLDGGNALKKRTKTVQVMNYDQVIEKIEKLESLIHYSDSLTEDFQQKKAQKKASKQFLFGEDIEEVRKVLISYKNEVETLYRAKKASKRPESGNAEIMVSSENTKQELCLLKKDK